MSLSPKDMDFNEARHAAAREIALALGVPPMLLAIPGDNTYSNLAEAQRILWRQTVLPLVAKLATALTNWLAPAYGEVPGFSPAPSSSDAPTTRSPLRLVPDLDHLPALAPEREALWSSLEKLSFLTPDEKRAAIGYAPLGETPDADPAEKRFNPAQLRIPAGQPGGGQWTDGGGGDEHVERIHRRRGGPKGTPAQEAQYAAAAAQARQAARRVRQLDPTWREPTSMHAQSIEGQIAHQQAIARAAEARLAEITRDALPGANPAWGVSRLRKELYDRGFQLYRPTTGSPGLEYHNPATGEWLRIMERSPFQRRSDPNEKHFFGHYYRYRESRDIRYRSAIPIPDKD